MKNRPAGKSLKKRMVLQLIIFTSGIMTLNIIGTAILLTSALNRELHQSLTKTVIHYMSSIEQHISYLMDSTEEFSENHFIINSLIDPQGKEMYLPELVKDFSSTRDIMSVTILDFEGRSIHSSSANLPDYHELESIRKALVRGESIIQTMEKRTNILIVAPVLYYETPQGAIVAEFRIAGIVSRILPEDDSTILKLYHREKAIYGMNTHRKVSYTSIHLKPGNDLPYMRQMELSMEMGVRKAKYLMPANNTVIHLAIIGVISLIAAILIAMRMGNSIAFPILNLCEKVRLSSENELIKCSPVGTHDELEELARVFDQRTELLIQSRNKLEKSNIQLKQEIADRKRAERSLEESEAKLQQAQKMEAVGRLAGGVAHDFNNLLTTIIGYCELIVSEDYRRESISNNLAEIRKSAERAASLTQQLLAFSRKQILQAKVININAIVSNLTNMLERLIEEDIDLTIKLEPDLPNIKADPARIEQIIMNLVVNAKDAMEKGGKLTIETRTCFIPDEEQHNTEDSDREVHLSISDTGCGIEPDILEHIFEPFYTTKDIGRGTGLGLSTVYGIVIQSGGSIDVASEPGLGTTFSVYLPVSDEKAEEETDSSEDTHGGTERILIVEDEDSLRKMVCKALEGYGYTLFEAKNGPSAMSICENGTIEKIQLLITDVIMPEMNGPELAQRLMVTNPDLKTLFISGYTSDAIMQHGVLEKGVNFLQKPFSPQILASKVRQVLDTRG